MSGEAAMLVRTWKVGRYTATLTMPKPVRGEVRIACIEWEPYLPTRLTDEEMAEYVAGRDQAFASAGLL